MNGSWRTAIERFGVDPAPPELHLTHSLLNSFGPATFSDMELLDDATSAQEWMNAALEEWQTRHSGAPVAPIPVTPSTVRGVKKLRAEVRELLGDGLDDVSDALTAPLRVTMIGGRFELVPQGTGANWLRSAVSSELMLAQEHQLLRRFKVCQNPACLVAFYDQSKSNTRIWHDMARCGTPKHVREWRLRQKATVTD